MTESVERAGFEPGVDVVFAIDVAAHSLWNGERGKYHLAREDRHVSTSEMIDIMCAWVDEFPVVSIEDALDEDDWDGWKNLTNRLGDRVNLIGDDLFTTNLDRLARGVDSSAANGVLVKANQNGTLSGTLDVVSAARSADYVCVVSARSGETEDSFISDLAVATGVGQIKVGSVRCSDRLAKYNQLLRIAEDTTLPFAEMAAYPRFLTRRLCELEGELPWHVPTGVRAWRDGVGKVGPNPLSDGHDRHLAATRMQRDCLHCDGQSPVVRHLHADHLSAIEALSAQRGNVEATPVVRYGHSDGATAVKHSLHEDRARSTGRQQVQSHLPPQREPCNQQGQG
jgi:hypothetical protein